MRKNDTVKKNCRLSVPCLAKLFFRPLKAELRERKSDDAVGLLKKEMGLLGSLIIRAAMETARFIARPRLRYRIPGPET